ncbi:tetratricopeptide repeat protein [Parabacteroides faecis]|uniref:tetratricopeptide repeat protein n=1 Tax=Parabacteroides faecis TaxID=1217282 RepID=UPI0021646C9D|nr:tetratricopeptide repeat protein [Parabacteroides faecis]MCS2890631.1 tetratricopeptide repeat protein [Parabacteroides faecis]UVQ45700.1 tetratricopeptide repeat protein [Parabacteroides faecis]
MKLTPLLILFFIVGCLSCKRENHIEKLLNEAEALLVTNPDTAYIILNTIDIPHEMSDRLLAEWCMLSGESADKIQEDMPSVSYLLQAQKWYAKNGSPEEQARIGLFLGRSYLQDKEFEKAMDTYMEALDIATDHEIYNQAGYISSYMADLYLFEYMADAARQKYEDGANYFLKANNKRSYALALRDIGRMWAYSDSVTKALPLLQKADSIVSVLNDKRAMASITNGLGNLYEMLGDYQNAEKYLLKSLELDKDEVVSSNLALISMYTKINELEKARFYLNKVNATTDDSALPDIFYLQYLLEKADQKTEKALECLEQYYIASDSIVFLQNESNIIKMEKKYQQEKILKENSQLRISKQIYFVLIIFFIVVCLVVFSFYQLKLNKQQKKIYQQQITLDQNKYSLSDLNEKLQKGEQLILEIKNELNKTEEQVNFQNTLEEQQTIYLKQKEELEQINAKIHQLRNDKLLASSIGKKVMNLSKSVKAGSSQSLFTPKDWITLQKQVYEIYVSLPQFLQKESLSLTSSDIECCYLSLFQLGPNAEAILLNINPHSASRRRSRLREKFGIVGKNISLYEYLSRV